MKCEDCKWCVLVENIASGKEEFFCHKKSPVIGGTSERTYTVWPQVGFDYWCGEFKEKE